MKGTRDPIVPIVPVYLYTITLNKREMDQLIYILGLNISIPEKFGVEKSEDLNKGALYRFMSTTHALLNKLKRGA